MTLLFEKGADVGDCFPLASWDYLLPDGPKIILADFLQNVTASQDGASQNWGWLVPGEGRKHSNRNVCVHWLQQSLCRMSHTDDVWLGDRSNNRLVNKNAEDVALYQIRYTQKPYDMFRSTSLCGDRHLYVVPHTNANKIAFVRNEKDAPYLRGEELGVGCTTHTFSQSYIYYTMVSTQDPWISLESIRSFAINNLTVFNLGIEDDHTYVAEDIVVHNCDSLAGSDAGYGAGVYRLDALPAYPAHGQCLCSLMPIFPRRETLE